MKAVLEALQKSDLDLAIERMIELAGGPEELVSESDSKALGSRRVLEKVADILETLAGELSEENLIDAGLSYLSRLDSSVIPQVVDLYPSVRSDTVRRIFRRYLSEQAPYEGDVIATLTEHRDRGIIKEAVGILAMAGKGTRGWRLLHKFAEDLSNLPRASLAQQVVSRVSGQKQVVRLFRAADQDDSLKLRLGAARTLWKTEGGAAMFAPVADLVMRDEFALRDEKEIESLLKALIQLGGKRAVPILVDLTNTDAKLVVGPKRHKQMIQAAKRWLETARALRA